MEILSAIPIQQGPQERAQALVVLVESGALADHWPQELKDRLAPVLSHFPKALGEGLTSAIDTQRQQWLILAGVEGQSLSALRDRCAEAVRKLKSLEVSRADLWLPQEADFQVSMAVAEGLILGSYSFDKYKTSSKASAEALTLRFQGDPRGIEVGTILAQAQTRARDLANEPGNAIGPAELAEMATQMAAHRGLQCRVYDHREIAEMAMGALGAAGQGSQRPPKLVHLIYRPEEPRSPLRRIVLVGKGVTFDSGGLSLKTRDGMITMKSDKTGACNVIAAMEAVARLKPDLEVQGIFAALENMPDGGAYRPDDVVRAKNGKTIEIKSTDAEGRLALADALAYGCDQAPDLLIDMATLTGAATTALGNYTAAAFSNDEEVAEALIKAGRAEGERFQLLAMDDDQLRRQIDSPVADLKNSGGPGGGAITAAMFLREFVTPGIPWIHLDIAGVDFYDRSFGCYSEGCSAFGVRSCLRLILDS